MRLRGIDNSAGCPPNSRPRERGAMLVFAVVGVLAATLVAYLIVGSTFDLRRQLARQNTVDAAVLGAAGVQAAILDMNAAINNVIVISHIVEMTTMVGGLLGSAGLCLTVVGCPEGMMMAATRPTRIGLDLNSKI